MKKKCKNKKDYFGASPWLINIPGTSVYPFNIYEDSFKYRDKWYFLSYEHHEPLVIIELNGHKKYNYVIFQIENPTEVASEIRKHLKLIVTVKKTVTFNQRLIYHFNNTEYD